MEGTRRDERVLELLRVSLPSLVINEVSSTPVPDVYAVEARSGDALMTLHLVHDGAYAIVGDLFELTGSGFVNRTEQDRERRRRDLIDEINVLDLVTFPSSSETRARIYVFTDVNCGFCRKFHAEIGEYNDLGIEVRYLAFPRAGPDSVTGKLMTSAWCADDRRAALTLLKQGKEIPESLCSDTVGDQFELGRTMGISATPSIVTAHGKLELGYLPAKQLGELLGLGL